MTVLTVRTEKPDAEIALYEDERLVVADSWLAHRQLAETLHSRIRGLLARNGLDYQDIDGIICFAGPGSFTGLRIGITVGNALGYALHVPVVGAGGEQWAQEGLASLKHAGPEAQAVPEYGADAHITKPRH